MFLLLHTPETQLGAAVSRAQRLTAEALGVGGTAPPQEVTSATAALPVRENSNAEPFDAKLEVDCVLSARPLEKQRCLEMTSGECRSVQLSVLAPALLPSAVGLHRRSKTGCSHATCDNIR